MINLKTHIGRWPIGLFLAGLFFAASLGIALYLAANSVFTQAELTRAKARANLYQTTVEDTLRRLDYLPFILARNKMVLRAANGLDRASLSLRLAELAEKSGAEAIYLMDMDGLTIAASNYGSPQTFLGQNYRFRPYFQDAAKGRHAEFFAIGATTSRPGYFYADPVRNTLGQTVGVLVVKADLSRLTDIWRRSAESILVSNADGIVVLASDPDWRYGSIRTLGHTRRAAIALERQFGTEPLSLLDWKQTESGKVTFQGNEYLDVSAKISRQGWTLHYLGNADRAREQAWFVVILSAVLVVSVIAAVNFFRSRRLRFALAASLDDRARLEKEIEDRRAAERRLEKAQLDLQRASKLAALGELAASITHELGQPISAMRNYIAAEELSGEEDHTGLVQNLSSIASRMENITKQLRFFSSPVQDPLGPVLVKDVLAGALSLTKHTIDQADITLRIDGGDIPEMISANAHRLEQVLVNLIRNAVSAMQDCPIREMAIELVADDFEITLSVSDTGLGLNNKAIETLQEPFHTTRRSGEGMGLGLAISTAIVKEHNGRISAHQRKSGGARFSVTIPRLATPKDPQ